VGTQLRCVGVTSFVYLGFPDLNDFIRAGSGVFGPDGLKFGKAHRVLDSLCRRDKLFLDALVGAYHGL